MNYAHNKVIYTTHLDPLQHKIFTETYQKPLKKFTLELLLATFCEILEGRMDGKTEGWRDEGTEGPRDGGTEMTSQ